MHKSIPAAVALAMACTALTLSMSVVPAAASKALSTRTPMMGIPKGPSNAHSGPAMGIPKAGSNAHSGPKPRHMGEKASTTGTYAKQGCGRRPSRGCRHQGGH